MLDIHTSKMGNSLNLEDSPIVQEISSLIPVRSLLDVPHLRLYIISAIGFWIIFWGNCYENSSASTFPFRDAKPVKDLQFVFKKKLSSLHLWQSRDNKGFGTVFSIAATACQLVCFLPKVAQMEKFYWKNNCWPIQSKWTWPKRAMCPWPLKKRNTRTKIKGQVTTIAAEVTPHRTWT